MGTGVLALGLAVGLGSVWTAQAKRPKVALFEPTTLDREQGELGGIAAPKRFGSSHAHGGTLAADETGLWVLERTAGALIRTDHAGEVKATIELHPNLGELVLGPAGEGGRSLYVADRSADTLLRYTVDGDTATPAGELKVTEPHGVALSPDGATLFLTSVANHELVAVDTATMKMLWRKELVAEPRPVAVTPDGESVLVGFLTSGAIARVSLKDQSVRWHALSPRDPIEIEEDFEEHWGEGVSARPVEAESRFDVPKDTGRRQARMVFAITFVGDGAAVAGVQVATSQMELRPAADRQDSYGGGAAEIAPIEYRFARIAEPGEDGYAAIDQHHLTLHQPRSLAYDRTRDVLYVGGYGDDEIVALAHASREHPTMLWHASLGLGTGCGIDGLTLIEGQPGTAAQVRFEDEVEKEAGKDGKDGTDPKDEKAGKPDEPEGPVVDPSAPGMALWAHCELTRSVVRIDLDPNPERIHSKPLASRKWVRGPALAESKRDAKVEKGAELFRRGEDFSLGGALACASCHPEGRNDGLSWRLGRSILQTPMLAGRVEGTSPYKWTGEDPNLVASFMHTIERIGGAPEDLERSELEAIEAYLRSLPPPRPPDTTDAEALARGKAVFEDACAMCHEGEQSTDQSQHEFDTTMRKVDTPSLIGLAHSNPYYHDGSAVDLQTLLDDRGSIHDMVDSSDMSAQQRADLIVYLRSL